MDNELKFYFSSSPFSNFYKYSFKYNGILFPTSEHCYQYEKMLYLKSIGENTDSILLKILNSKSPKEAKNCGQCNFYTQDNVIFKSETWKDSINKWDSVKLDKMLEILKVKFSDKRLKKYLLDTGDRILKEDSPVDYYWGIGRDNTGRNELGNVLMKIRKQFKKLNKKESILNFIK